MEQPSFTEGSDGVASGEDGNRDFSCQADLQVLTDISSCVEQLQTYSHKPEQVTDFSVTLN